MARRSRRRLPPRALLLATLLLAPALYLFWLPDPSPLKRTRPETTAYMELRKREAAAAGREARLAWTWVPYAAIAQPLKDAVVLAEDGSFWRHRGVDWQAVWEAVKVNLAKGRFAYGGSTITQQLARNLYLSPSKNPLRKAKEALIARRLERALGKRRILELYLNVAEWGPDVFGCEAAARRYYGKSAAALTHEEAAALAAVLPSPRRWSPVGRTRRVERRVRRLLARMRAAGKIPEVKIPLESPEETLEPDEPTLAPATSTSD